MNPHKKCGFMESRHSGVHVRFRPTANHHQASHSVTAPSGRTPTTAHTNSILRFLISDFVFSTLRILNEIGRTFGALFFMYTLSQSLALGYKQVAPLELKFCDRNINPALRTGLQAGRTAGAFSDLCLER